MNMTERDRDLGTAYAMKPSTSRTELTEVARGTPMGELLRLGAPLLVWAAGSIAPTSSERPDLPQVSGPVYCSSRAQASAP
jgi:hypothetical protein